MDLNTIQNTLKRFRFIVVIILFSCKPLETNLYMILVLYDKVIPHKEKK